MQNSKPIVRPGSDGVLEIKVGERTLEVRREYLEGFAFDIQMSVDFINRAMERRQDDEVAKPPVFAKADLKVLEAELAGVGFTPNRNSRR